MNNVSSIGLNSASWVPSDALFGLFDNHKSSKSGAGSFDALLGSLVDASGAAKTARVDDFSAAPSSSQFLQYIEQAMTSVVTPNAVPMPSIIGNSGPLPTFLREVVASRHLDATQTKALYDVAARNMDIVKTPYTVEKLAMELQEAGI